MSMQYVNKNEKETLITEKILHIGLMTPYLTSIYIIFLREIFNWVNIIPL